MAYNSALIELVQKPDVNKIIFSDDSTLYSFDTNSFKREKLLGSSQYPVYEYLHVPTERKIAVKLFPKIRNKKARCDPNNYYHIKKITNEIEILQKVRDSDSIVDFYGFGIDHASIYVFMEKMEMTLEDLINMPGSYSFVVGISDQIINNFNLFYLTAMNCLKVLEFCYKKNLKHGDIKPANILFNEYGEIKINDFGEAYSEKKDTTNGTLLYWSPERFNSAFPDYTSDLWSLGITLLEIWYEQNPILFHSKCQNLNDSSQAFINLQNFMSKFNKANLLEIITQILGPIDSGVFLLPCENTFIIDFIETCFSNEKIDIALKKLENILIRLHNEMEDEFHDLPDFIEISDYISEEPDINKIKFSDDDKEYLFDLNEFEFISNSNLIVYCVSRPAIHIKTNKKLFINHHHSSDAMSKEIDLLKILSGHPNVVEYYGFGKAFGLRFTFTEWLDFNLQDICTRSKTILPESFFRNIITTIISVFDEVHSMGYCKFSLETDGILFRRDGLIKLFNFEFIQDFEDIGANDDFSLNFRTIGPPEIVLEDKKTYMLDNRSLLFRIDVWHLGITILKTIMDNNQIIFNGSSDTVTHLKKMYDDWEEHAHYNPDFTTLYNLYFDFILEFKAFFKSSFSQIFIEFLLSCLEFDVNDRPDCENIMKSAFYQECLKTFDDDQAMVVQVLNETFDVQRSVEKMILSKKEEKKRRSIKNITHDVICDICNAGSIRGIRYKCLECEAYDLCQECLDKNGHKQHVILRLVKATNMTTDDLLIYLAKAKEFQNMDLYTKCDECDKNLADIFYTCYVCSTLNKCGNIANSFNLCVNCEKEGLHFMHRMVRIIRE